MIKYIVYWVLTTTVPVACPDSGPDEFGRTSNVSCSVFHARIVTENKSREFEIRKDAIDFFENAKYQQSNNGWSFNEISNVRIDSLMQ